jgi:hypothetical protein
MRRRVSWLTRRHRATRHDVTYGARDDDKIVDLPCVFLLEQLLSEVATDVAGTDNCEFLEARHDTVW